MLSNEVHHVAILNVQFLLPRIFMHTSRHLRPPLEPPRQRTHAVSALVLVFRHRRQLLILRTITAQSRNSSSMATSKPAPRQSRPLSRSASVYVPRYFRIAPILAGGK